jgi:hypothetical protein
MFTFDPKPQKVGDEWQVVAAHPDGRTENIVGFLSKAEATEWLASERSVAWLWIMNRLPRPPHLD